MAYKTQIITVQVPVGQNEGQAFLGDFTCACMVGRNGLVAPTEKHEGDGMTPMGLYSLRFGLYKPYRINLAALHLDFPFVPRDNCLSWIDDPEDEYYNRLVLFDEAEEPKTAQTRLHPLDIVIPIGYNDAQPVSGRGSALLLHMTKPDRRPTEGCIAFDEKDMMILLPQLTPGAMIEIKSV